MADLPWISCSGAWYTLVLNLEPTLIVIIFEATAERERKGGRDEGGERHDDMLHEL